MKDRFRFRAWDKVCNCYVPDDWKLYLNGGVSVEGSWATNDIIVEQCTGLRDRHGTLVFEGDIVEAWSEGVCRRVSVKWRQEGAPMWILYPAYEDDLFWNLHGFKNPSGDFYDNVTIVGNIHENPELLNEN